MRGKMKNEKLSKYAFANELESILIQGQKFLF